MPPRPPPTALPSARTLRRQLRGIKARERGIRKVREQLKNASAGWDWHGTSSTTSAAYEAAATTNRDSTERVVSPDDFPVNQELDDSLARLHAMGRDPRPRLDMYRNLYPTIIFSVASPVGKWDSLDLKPQPFALGSYLALPVFTSLVHLQSFCNQFALTVRGPDGSLWGCSEAAAAAQKRLRGGQAATKRKRSGSGKGAKKSEGGGGSAATSFRPGMTLQAQLAAQQRATEERERTEHRARAKDVERFEYDTAVPLPIYGNFEQPYLYGYFGKATTIFENVASVPKLDVDVVINPATPLELVLGRETQRYLVQRENVIERAMQDIERVVRAEFSRVFAQHCPEVTAARSVVFPKPMPEGTPPEQAQHELVIVVTSNDFALTMQRLGHAKQVGDIIGHESLVVVPLGPDTPGHVVDASVLFYDMATRLSEHMQLAGQGLTALTDEPFLVDSRPTGWGGSLGDVGMEYLEPHAAFTAQYNLRRAVRESRKE